MFEKQMSELQISMPILDAFMLVPQYSKFLKDIVTRKKKEMEGMVVLTHECSAILQRLSVPRKLEDPGSFTLPCAIGPLTFERCLCDLGASVSLMPLSIAKKLGFTQYKKCKLSIVLADRSVKLPIGILEDLPVTIGNYEIPTDFVVLEMDDEPKDPLLLGRPFLATVGAIVNVREGKIDLHLGKGNILHFDTKGVMKRPTIESQVFYVEEVDALADEYLEELALEDAVHHALTIDREDRLIENKGSLEYAKILDSHKIVDGDPKFIELPRVTHYVASAEKQDEVMEAKWSELKAPEVDKVKIDVMIGLQPPRSVKDNRSFLGHISFYRRFIRDFSKIAIPSAKHLCKATAFNFDGECLEAFKRLKILGQRKDQKILKRELTTRDEVLLHNSRLKLFPGKLKLRWSKPFRIKEVRPYREIVLETKEGREFTVNGQRVKLCLRATLEAKGVSVPLSDPISA